MLLTTVILIQSYFALLLCQQHYNIGINPSAPSPSPLESCLNIPSAQSPAVIVGTFMGGIMAGALCTVIAALSWSVIKDSYIFHL